MKPWLLEVNHSPSFTTDTPLDRSIKERVILDAISLLGISAENREKYYNQVKVQIHQRAVKGKDYHALRSERLTLQKQMLEERDTLEAQHKGGFHKIHPTEDPGMTRVILENAQKLLYEQTGGKPKPRKEEVKNETVQKMRAKPPVCPQKLEPAQEEPTPRRTNVLGGRPQRQTLSAEPPPTHKSSLVPETKTEAIRLKKEAILPKPPARSSRERLQLVKPTSSGEFLKPKTVQLDVKTSTDQSATARQRPK